jgi:hypothetical protein
VHASARVRGHVRACACVCVRVPLLIQHVTHTRHTVTSFVAPLAAPYFSRLSRKRHDFRENIIEHKMCVSTFSTTFV